MPYFCFTLYALNFTLTKKSRNRESNWFCAQFLEFPEVYSSRSQNTHRKKFQTPNLGILLITIAL